ncbi:MAG: AAA family ATPase, partial [Proteobacteria bacterium]|nr:AAA family ATPase [Pseudomonadota bacterium]
MQVLCAANCKTFKSISPWKKFNKLIRGAKPGQLVVITARPKVGKTTFVLNWMYDLAKSFDVPVGMYCCEMKQKKLAKKVVAMANKDFTTLEEITGEQVAHTLYSSPSRSIHFGYPTEDVLSLDNVCDWV